MNPRGSSFEKLTWAFGPPAHDENQIEHSGISLHPKAHITANIFRTATGRAGSSGCAIPGTAHRRPRPAPAASRSSSHQGWSSAFAGTFRASASSNRANSLRSGSAQRRFQLLIDDGLDGRLNPLPHQLLERSFPLPSTPATALHGVILRHAPPSGRELWLNSPDHDAFSLFHQLRDTTYLLGSVSYYPTG
jgi:hypothetical protein